MGSDYTRTKARSCTRNQEAVRAIKKLYAQSGGSDYTRTKASTMRWHRVFKRHAAIRNTDGKGLYGTLQYGIQVQCEPNVGEEEGYRGSEEPMH